MPVSEGASPGASFVASLGASLLESEGGLVSPAESEGESAVPSTPASWEDPSVVASGTPPSGTAHVQVLGSKGVFAGHGS
jgi:hypothetical protein